MRGLVIVCVIAGPAAAGPKTALSLEATRVDSPPDITKPPDIDPARITVTASSTLACDKKANCYDGKAVVDRKLDTAWCEGDKGDGEGASITLAFDKAETVGGFYIAPHYAKDFARAWGNNRVAKLEVKTDAGTASVALDDLGAYVKKHNEDKETGGDLDGASRDERIQVGIGFQVDFGDAITTKTVKLTLRGVHRGAGSHDTCISEIQLIK